MGAANIEDDGGYAGKVMAEYARLRQVATGRSVPLTPPQAAPMPRAIPTIAPALPAKPAGEAAEDKVAALANS